MKSKKHKLFRRGLAGLALVSVPMLAPHAAYAVGEQNGKVSGVITDKMSGAPLPGARIEIRGSSLIGGPRAVATGDDGSYEFIAVPPGNYDVTLTFEGVKPLRRRIVVRQDETFPLNIAWTPEEAKEELKVIYEERRMTRPDTTQTGTVLTNDQQSRVATTRSYQGIASQVAGVVGVTGQAGGNPQIKGAMDSHNRYLVDGLDITDPVTNTFSANINFDSIGSVEIMTGGAEAQYNALGGVINLTTNAGSNEWHIDSSLYVNHQALSMGSQYGANLYNGVKPFGQTITSPNDGYQANINVGGPIIKNKWWFNFSFEFDRRGASINIGPPLDVQHPTRVFTGYLFRVKTAIAPSPKHRLSLSISTDPAFIDNIDQSNSLLGVAEDRQNQGGAFGILQWDYFISDKVNTNIQTGFQYQALDDGPQGYFGSIDNSAYAGRGLFSSANDTWVRDRPQHNNQDDGTTWYQGGGISLDRRYTFQFDPSVSVRGNWLGKHEAKFGIQTRIIKHTFDFSYPGNQVYTDAGGGPGEKGLCLPEQGQTAGCYQRTDQMPYSQNHFGYSVGFYAQDRWKITNWLRVNPGLRFDYGRSTNTIGEVVSNLWGFGPRLGLIFDLTQDQKTIFTAYYGRANEVLSLLAAAYADVTPTSTTNQWNPMTKQFEPLYTSGGTDGYKLQPNTTPPHTDEVTLSFRRELFANSVAGVDYTYKRVGNIWDSQEVNQIWDPTGNRVVDYANGKSQQVFLYTTFPENWRVYQGIDFIFESRPRQEWDFSVIYTLSWLYGPGAEQFAQVSGSQQLSQFYNPRMAGFYDGYLPEDRRHQLKIRASYNYKGITIGTFFNFQSGTSLTKRYFNGYDGGYTSRRSPTGTEPTTPNDVTAIAEFRLPPYFSIDTRVAYDLTSLFTTKLHMTLIADMFNMLNLDAANSGTGAANLEARDVATYATIRSRQPPFRLQLGLRIQY